MLDHRKQRTAHGQAGNFIELTRHDPAPSFAMLMRTKSVQVKFLPETPGTSVTAFAVARGSKLLAVAESDDKSVTVGSTLLQPEMAV